LNEAIQQTRSAYHELIDLLRNADREFLSGSRAVGDEISVVEGYRWLTEILSVALECYLWADTDRPSIVPIVSPTRKFGGDNADAFYHFAPLNPQRTYRLRGIRGDAVYLSVTVYGGPSDGRWSNRIVGSLNDRNLTLLPDGAFEVWLGPAARLGNFIRLDPDAVCLITRDYLVDPVQGRKASWQIEAVDPSPPPRLTDAEVSARFRAAANFIRDLLQICPLPANPSKRNQIDEPYPVPQATYGWAAGDAAYAMGSFELTDDQALVLEGTPPPCAFWNLCLWNPFLQTYDYRYERVTINSGQVRYEADGSFRLVIALRDPGVPNWISTAGHHRGWIWFRWFLPERNPTKPHARVVPLATLSG